MLSVLPRYGLELKIIALLLLAVSNWSIYKNLLYCEMKPKKQEKKQQKSAY
ncbi:MAG: hypothetical protein LBP53_00805 [Candidatus Peribacteria bacterium]|jgi:hypothetical protein|nr:hypothetical protein [Candidatus Peribacteria bacterium]